MLAIQYKCRIIKFLTADYTTINSKDLCPSIDIWRYAVSTFLFRLAATATTLLHQ